MLWLANLEELWRHLRRAFSKKTMIVNTLAYLYFTYLHHTTRTYNRNKWVGHPRWDPWSQILLCSSVSFETLMLCSTKTIFLFLALWPRSIHSRIITSLNSIVVFSLLMKIWSLVLHGTNCKEGKPYSLNSKHNTCPSYGNKQFFILVIKFLSKTLQIGY